jgi:FKBP-type peptidyl-prolyl cis-trans isomerase 2
MRKILILLMGVLILSGCLEGETSKPETSVKPVIGTPPGESASGTPGIGDVVKINYIMSAKGEVVDSSYEEVAKNSPNSDLILFLHPFGFEPSTFIVGSGHVNPEFSKGVRNMTVGEKNTLILPPQKSIGGERRDDLIQVMPRFSFVPREETIPTPIFRSAYGLEPAIGHVIGLDYWNSTLVEVDDEVTRLRHNPAEGSVFEFPGGNISIVFNESMITMEFIPKINVTSITADERYVTIPYSNETHMVVDYNHPLAGETLEVEMVLEEISKPMLWLFNLNDSLTAPTEKPVFILFTNVSCVTCRRIQGESLTHPLALALKDEFVWVLIDIERREDIADQYGVETLPLILILKNDKEISRISNFLPPRALRAEMEAVLAAT